MIKKKLNKLVGALYVRFLDIGSIPITSTNFINKKGEFMSLNKQSIKESISRTMETMLWVALALLLYVIIDKQYVSIGSDNSMNTTYTYSDVSTAINEKSELIITDRNTGKYKLYSDSVAMGIFNMMATQLSNEYEINIKRKAY